MFPRCISLPLLTMCDLAAIKLTMLSRHCLEQTGYTTNYG